MILITLIKYMSYNNGRTWLQRGSHTTTVMLCVSTGNDLVILTSTCMHRCLHAPYRTQFFHFRTHFNLKVPTSEAKTPPKWVHTPPREILDPALVCTYNSDKSMYHIHSNYGTPSFFGLQMHKFIW